MLWKLQNTDQLRNKPETTCCIVRYDFCIKTMFGSSLPPVIVGGLMFYLRYLCLFAYCFVQFLWIVHFLLPLRYSLTFISYELTNWW